MQRKFLRHVWWWQERKPAVDHASEQAHVTAVDALIARHGAQVDAKDKVHVLPFLDIYFHMRPLVGVLFFQNRCCCCCCFARSLVNSRFIPSEKVDIWWHSMLPRCCDEVLPTFRMVALRQYSVPFRLWVFTLVCISTWMLEWTDGIAQRMHVWIGTGGRYINLTAWSTGRIERQCEGCLFAVHCSCSGIFDWLVEDLSWFWWAGVCACWSRSSWFHLSRVFNQVLFHPNALIAMLNVQEGWTALHFACVYGHVDVVDALITQHGALVEAQINVWMTLCCMSMMLCICSQ